MSMAMQSLGAGVPCLKEIWCGLGLELLAARLQLQSEAESSEAAGPVRLHSAERELELAWLHLHVVATLRLRRFASLGLLCLSSGSRLLQPTTAQAAPEALPCSFDCAKKILGEVT